MLVEFTNEATWSGAFLCQIFDYWFNLFTSYGSVQLSLFFLVGFVFLGVCPFHLSYLICGCTITHSILMIFLISVESVIMSPRLFLILTVWVFFLFLLVNLAKGLSILFIFFSKNQVLVLLLQFFVCFIYLCSNLYYLLPSASLGVNLLLFF